MIKIINGILAVILALIFQSCSPYNGLYLSEGRLGGIEYYDIRNEKFDYYYSDDLSGPIKDHGSILNKGDSLVFLFADWKERELVLEPRVKESEDDSNYTRFKFYFINKNNDSIVDFGYLFVNGLSYAADSLGIVLLRPRRIVREFSYAMIEHPSPYITMDTSSNLFDIYLSSPPKSISRLKGYINVKYSMKVEGDSLLRRDRLYLKKENKQRRQIIKHH